MKIRFKEDGRIAFLCDFCETVWFENEQIGLETGHAMHSLSQEFSREYTIEELDEKDQDHRPL